MNVTELSTPCLVIDDAVLQKRYTEFVGAFPGIDVHYAMKCNPDPGLLSTLHAAGCRFEIASANELDLLLATGVDARDVLFSNPVKTNDDIRRTAAAGVWRFAVDSVAELDKIATISPGASVYFRLATDAGASGVPSEGKFGVDAGTIECLALTAVELGLIPYGIAFHVGSQMLDPDAWCRAIEAAGNTMRVLQEHDIVLAMLDLGGGFPARYDAAVPALVAYGSTITDAVSKFVPYAVSLVIEPGRALVADAGCIVSRVIGVADRFGARWIHLDVGAFNGMMEALESQNRLRYPMRAVPAAGGAHAGGPIDCHVTGPSCDSQDTILFDVPLPADVAVDDFVIIGSAGAYTVSYASTFNGFDIPATVHDIVTTAATETVSA